MDVLSFFFIKVVEENDIQSTPNGGHMPGGERMEFWLVRLYKGNPTKGSSSPSELLSQQTTRRKQ